MTIGRCPFAAGTHAVDEIHDHLRTDGTGVHQAELPDGSPVWIVSGYDAVTSLLADPRVSAAKSASTMGYLGQNLPAALDMNLLNMDGDQHRRVRRLATAAFSPHNHAYHGEVVANAVTGLLDQMPSYGEIDLMSGLCEALPPHVIGTLLGLPADKLGRFREAARPILQLDTSKAGAAVQSSLAMMLGLVGSVIADKRTSPGEDLLSQWIAARDGNDRLTEDELMSLVFITIVGGFENVTSLIAIVIDELLRQHESEARQHLADGAGFGDLVRAVMGEVAPVNYALRRFLLEGLEVNGVRIPQGHTVILSLRSANRDPHRRGRPQLVFGHGRHFCIGAKLAEMEVTYAAKGVLRKWPQLELTRPRDSWQLRPSWITYALADFKATAR